MATHTTSKRSPSHGTPWRLNPYDAPTSIANAGTSSTRRCFSDAGLLPSSLESPFRPVSTRRFTTNTDSTISAAPTLHPTRPARNCGMCRTRSGTFVGFQCLICRNASVKYAFRSDRSSSQGASASASTTAARMTGTRKAASRFRLHRSANVFSIRGRTNSAAMTMIVALIAPHSGYRATKKNRPALWNRTSRSDFQTINP